MQTFWRLLEESVIVQGLVTVGMAGAVIYMAVAGRDIPEALFGLASMALGFYFGAKGQLTGKQAAKAAIREIENGNN